MCVAASEINSADHFTGRTCFPRGLGAVLKPQAPGTPANEHVHGHVATYGRRTPTGLQSSIIRVCPSSGL